MDRFGEYAGALFAPEDAVLMALREDADRAGLPPIAISADTGRLLQVMIRAVGARRILEVGTLGGYSAIWMARALPAEGRLITLEISESHAAVARRNIERKATKYNRISVTRRQIRDLKHSSHYCRHHLEDSTRRFGQCSLLFKNMTPTPTKKYSRIPILLEFGCTF